MTTGLARQRGGFGFVVGRVTTCVPERGTGDLLCRTATHGTKATSVPVWKRKSQRRAANKRSRRSRKENR